MKVNLINLFNKNVLTEVLDEISKNMEIREQENNEVAATLFIKKTAWLNLAVQEFQKGKYVKLDLESSTFDTDDLSCELSYKTIDFSENTDDLVQKFHNNFFLENILSLVGILKDVSDVEDKSLWDIIHYTIFKEVGYDEANPLIQYLKRLYPVFSKEIRKTVNQEGEGYIYVRNSCCGKYLTKKNENCKICPLYNA